MKKRLYSLFIAFSIFAALIPIGGVYADENNAIEIDTVCALGLMSKDADGEFMNENRLTRGEFAQILASLYLTGDEDTVRWKEKFFQTAAEEAKPIEGFGENSLIFTDISEGSEFYEAVEIVSRYGLMDGFSDGTFGAEMALTYDQAAKVMVTILGYRLMAESYGGFPAGYNKMASELKLFKKINARTGNITREDMALMLYNALEVKIFTLQSITDKYTYTSDSEDTFLKKMLGMEKVTGRITDNGYSNLIGQQTVSKDFVVIDGINIRVSGTTEYVRDLLGRTVCAYYYDNDGDYTLCYAGTDNLDKVVTVNAKDYVSYSDGRVVYETDGKEKTIRFDKNAYMVYNGSGKASFNEEDFDFESGSIQFITSHKSSSNDLIIITKYDSMYLDYVDMQNKKLYSKNIDGTDINNRVIDFDTDDNYYLRIYNAKGEADDISSVNGGCVISVAQGTYTMKIYCSENRISDFTIKSTSFDDGKLIISNGSESYEITENYIDQNGKDSIRIGRVYTLYCDIFGDVVYINESAGTDYEVAMLVRATHAVDEDDIVRIKVYGTDQRIITREAADTVTIVNSDNVSKKYKKPEQIYAQIRDYRSIFRYKLDADKKINYIELPTKQKVLGNEDNRLSEIVMSKDRDYSEENGGYYYKPNGGFAGQMLVDTSTVVFGVIPEKIGEEDGYSMYDRSVFNDDYRYEVKGYTVTSDSHLAQYVVYELESSSGDFLSVKDKTIGIFDNMYDALDDDDMPCTMLEFYSGTKKVQYALSDDFKGITNLQGDTDFEEDNQRKKFTLERGDIFRYAVDSDKKINIIQLLVDENAKNPMSGGSGNLAGSIGYWDSSSQESYAHSNPYAVSNSGTEYRFSSAGNHWSVGGNAEMRNALYYPVYSRDGSMICLTTKDLTVLNYDFSGENDSRYITDFYNRASATFITFNGKALEVKTQPVSNIKTYELTGHNCDRVFVMSRVGSVNNMIVYTNHSK